MARFGRFKRFGRFRRFGLDNQGGLTLEGWEIGAGSGEISLDPSTNHYLTIAENDDASHDPFPFPSECFEYRNDAGQDFRVQYALATERSTTYDVSISYSFEGSGADDRITLTPFKGNGVSSISFTIQSGTRTPFNASGTTVFRVTTDADALGDAVYMRVNQNSTSNNTLCWFSTPTIVEVP